MQNQLHLLKSRRFLPLFITQFFGAFNDNIFKNAFLIWFTYDIAQKNGINTQLMVTIASALFIAPFFLFSAIAGQVADKYEKSQLIQIIKLAEILIMACSFIGFYFEKINLLLGLLFLMGTHSTFFNPLKYSLLPEHLKDGELIGGNAFIEGGTFLAILLGTLTGGIVICCKGGIEIISLTVLSFALLGYLGSSFIPRSPIGNANLKISFNIFSQTLQIINCARKEEASWLSIIGISWFWLVGISFVSQFPVYTRNLIGGNEAIVTLFLAIFSIGVGLGALICNKLLKGKINAHLTPFACAGVSLGIIIFCAASYFYSSLIKPPYLLTLQEFLTLSPFSWLIILGFLITAISSGVYIVPLYAIMQHRSPERYLARIIAANSVLNSLFMIFSGVGIIVLSFLKLSLPEIFLLLSLINVVVFIAIRKITRI